MERRALIKNLLVITAASAILPSCLHNTKEASSIPLRNIKIDGSQERTLAEISETIIPATHIPGAKDTYAHLFALKIVDDCFEKDGQDKFVKGLNEVNSLAKKRFNTSFVESTPAQRRQLIADLESKKETGEAVTAFYKSIKDLTIQGYMNSKYVMTNVIKYELVPGRYNGFYPVKKVVHAI